MIHVIPDHFLAISSAHQLTFVVVSLVCTTSCCLAGVGGVSWIILVGVRVLTLMLW